MTTRELGPHIMLLRDGKSYVAVPIRSPHWRGGIGYNIHKWDAEEGLGVGAYLYTEGDSFVARYAVKGDPR